MTKYREILRLKSLGISEREISLLLRLLLMYLLQVRQ